MGFSLDDLEVKGQGHNVLNRKWWQIRCWTQWTWL